MLEEQAEVTMAAIAERAGVSRQAVYLHVADRNGLLVHLVEHIDHTLGLDEIVRGVFAAPSGVEALARLVRLHAEFTARIVSVTRVMDVTRVGDPGIAAAWENRMAVRLQVHRAVMQRIADEGSLADGWDVDTAATMTYAVTLPRMWEELVVERGWSAERYREHVTALLQGALVRSARRRR
jgi:AcrR family transcriptional regulator